MLDNSLPIIDISLLKDENIEKMSVADWDAKAKELDDAFTKYGFVYLKNHGVQKEIVDKAMELSDKFFAVSKDVKRPFTKSGTYWGYYYPGDKLTTEVKDLLELREMWDVPGVNKHPLCPSYPPIDGYQETLEEMIDQTRNLVKKLLRLISRALGLEEDFLANMHKGISDVGLVSKSTFRCLYYPALDKNIDYPEDAIRCREHTDYGTITLIFQDLTGGLQMQLKDGSWIDATPIEDTIVVNVCDLLGRLTGKYYAPILHRVPVPDDLTIPRQSISYFLAPDDDVLIKPVVDEKKIKVNHTPVLVDSYYNDRVDFFDK